MTQPTLESVKADLLMDSDAESVRDLYEQLSERRSAIGMSPFAKQDREEVDMLDAAVAGLGLTLLKLEEMADRLAPQKLARDLEEWAELQADERNAA